MSLVAILLPMFAQVVLTFVLLGWMSLLRLRVVRRGEVSPQQVALREPIWPPHVCRSATPSRTSSSCRCCSTS